MAIQPPDRGRVFSPVGTGSAYVVDITGSLGGHLTQPRAAAQCVTRQLRID